MPIKQALSIAFVFAWSMASYSQEVVPGHFIIKMKGRPSATRSSKLLGKIAGQSDLRGTFSKLNLHHVQTKAGQNEAQLLETLQADPDVEWVEPDYVLKLDIPSTNDDTRKYADDGGVEAFAGSDDYASILSHIHGQSAWTATSATSGEIPVVAVIDTGVDRNHSVFTSSGAIWTNPGEIPNDGIDNDGNGYIDDVHGWNFYASNNDPTDDDRHGTHVAGIILGVTQNIFPVSPATMAPARIRIMPLKFLGAGGSGSTSAAISAIYYAVNNGADVINNSWGGPSYSQGLHEALAYAYANRVFIASAAGNSATNNDVSPMYPAAYPIPSQIAVAASNDYDALASFSNYGRSTVMMAAPGTSIYSTVPGGYMYMSGTSMATPFISGLAALVKRESPQLTGYQILNLLVNAGSNFSQLASKTISGNRSEAYTSVVNAKGQVSALATQPAYDVSAYSAGRAPASEGASSPKAGCGLVGLSASGMKPRDPGARGTSQWPFVVALSLMPLLIWSVLRKSALKGASRRVHERFSMNSEIRVKVGGRELVGQLSTISLGGASFQADALLEKGGVVTLQIASPDGNEQVQVEGRVVWNEKNQAYGVQFQGAEDSVLSRIGNWTSRLAKSTN